jgi:hypothetical protein
MVLEIVVGSSIRRGGADNFPFTAITESDDDQRPNWLIDVETISDRAFYRRPVVRLIQPLEGWAGGLGLASIWYRRCHQVFCRGCKAVHAIHDCRVERLGLPIDRFIQLGSAQEEFPMTRLVRTYRQPSRGG